MADFTSAAGHTADSEYSIYTFDMPEKPGSRQRRWKKRETRTEMADALNMAESIFQTGKYGKVEVKQKYFDHRQNCKVDVTLKVFEAKNEKEVDLFAMFLFALICAAAAFAATSILNG